MSNARGNPLHVIDASVPVVRSCAGHAIDVADVCTFLNNCNADDGAFMAHAWHDVAVVFNVSNADARALVAYWATVRV